MKILSIDTSTKFLCLGLYDGAKVFEYNLEVGTKLSTLITVTIKRVLEASGLSLEKIDYFACGLGPGSFTGLRVGIATIKGLGWVAKKPIVGVSTLDILAKNAKASDKLIIPMIDARRNLIYCSAYKNKNGQLKRVKPYMLLSEDDFFKHFRANSVILGDAIGIYREKILKNIKGAELLDKDYWYPKAHNLIELALEKIKANKISDAFNIKPVYLYPKECQIRK